MILDWATHRVFNLAAICLTLALSACTGAQMIVPTPPVPLDPNTSVVGISLKGGEAFAPTQVYFLRLRDGQDSTGGLEILASNYQTYMELGHRQFYLLNAEPGRYLVVACRKERGVWQGATALTFFRKYSIDMTEVVVGPGQVGFMGKYNLLFPTIALLTQNDPDEAQVHYQKLMVSDPPSGFWGDFWHTISQG